MDFPESPRVVYAQNPLDEVICQLRFPAVLRIDSESPVRFQEAVRNEYPLFQERTQIQAAVPGLPEPLAAIIGNAASRAGRSYDFISDDKNWQLTLTRDFLALTCRKYRRWEDFKSHFSLAVDTLRSEYSPAFYSRIGLRYRDVIVRSRLGLSAVEWSQLLKPHAAGELNSEIAEGIEDVTRQVVVHVDQFDAKVTIQHGTARTRDTNEECYYIDADFFTERKTEIAHAEGILDYFNRQSGRLFRWFISDRLHSAMQPTAVAA